MADAADDDNAIDAMIKIVKDNHMCADGDDDDDDDDGDGDGDADADDDDDDNDDDQQDGVDDGDDNDYDDHDDGDDDDDDDDDDGTLRSAGSLTRSTQARVKSAQVTKGENPNHKIPKSCLSATQKSADYIVGEPRSEWH